MSYQILTDQDVRTFLDIQTVVRKIEDAFREKVSGTLVAPPRFSVETSRGSLVFTAGAATKKEKVIGFRAYTTHGKSTDTTQLVAVFDSENGELKGVVIGSMIGALRTGALGGAAVKYLSRSNSKSVGVLGSGLQARTQLEATAAVRDIKMVSVYSPNQDHREMFAWEMKTKLGVPVEAVSSVKEASGEMDIILCTTNSRQPIIDVDWIKPGSHINVVGPNEIDESVVQKCDVIVTDSLEQLKDHPKPLCIMNEKYSSKIIEMGDIIVGKKQGRLHEQDISLYCSAGLAGTEVIVANELFKLALARKTPVK